MPTLFHAGFAKADLGMCMSTSTVPTTESSIHHGCPETEQVATLQPLRTPDVDPGFIWKTAHEPVAFFSAVLAVAALIQAAIYFVQLCILRETNRISTSTKEIARIAKQESDDQRKAQSDSQRARLRVVGASVIDVVREDSPRLEPSLLGAVFTVRNDGLTPAMLSEVVGGFSFSKSEQPDLRPAIDHHFEIVPSGEAKRRTVTGHLTKDHIDRIEGRAEKIVVKAVFRYYDSFGGSHEITYSASVQIGNGNAILTPVSEEAGNAQS